MWVYEWDNVLPRLTWGANRQYDAPLFLFCWFYLTSHIFLINTCYCYRWRLFKLARGHGFCRYTTWAKCINNFTNQCRNNWNVTCLVIWWPRTGLCSCSCAVLQLTPMVTNTSKAIVAQHIYWGTKCWKRADIKQRPFKSATSFPCLSLFQVCMELWSYPGFECACWLS